MLWGAIGRKGRKRVRGERNVGEQGGGFVRRVLNYRCRWTICFFVYALKAAPFFSGANIMSSACEAPVALTREGKREQPSFYLPLSHHFRDQKCRRQVVGFLLGAKPPVLLLRWRGSSDANFDIGSALLSLHKPCSGLGVLLHLREANPGVEDGEEGGGDGDHDTVQDDEVGLVLHDGRSPSVGHLADTVDAANEDGEVGDGDAAGEELEAGSLHQAGGGSGEGSAVPVDFGGVVGDQPAEDEKCDDLPHDTRDHHVVADVLHVLIVVGGRG